MHSQFLLNLFLLLLLFLTVRAKKAEAALGAPKGRFMHNTLDIHVRVAETYQIEAEPSTDECTVEPRYNEVLGTIKITLFIQVSHYIRVKKQRNIKSWDQQNYLVIIKRVLLYPTSL